MGGKPSKSQVQAKRRDETRRYVQTVMKLAEAAVAERPMSMTTLDFVDAATARIRTSGAQEQWVKGAFAKAIESEADLGEFVTTLFDAHLSSFSRLFATMLFWDVRRAAVQEAAPAEQQSGGAAIASLPVSAASSKTIKNLEAEAPGAAAALRAAEEKVASLSEELASIAKDAVEKAAGDVKRGWARALDGGKSGKLDALGVTSALLYDNAQRFAALTFDLRMLVRPATEVLQKLVSAAGQLEGPLGEAVGAEAAAAVTQLEKATSASESGKLLQACVFPLAGASPFLPPVLRPSKPSSKDSSKAELLHQLSQQEMLQLSQQLREAQSHSERLEARLKELEASGAAVEEKGHDKMLQGASNASTEDMRPHGDDGLLLLEEADDDAIENGAEVFC